MAEALQDTRAPKVYLSNLTTKKGETYNFTTLDYLLEIEKYTGAKVDYVVCNNQEIAAAEGYQLIKFNPTEVAAHGTKVLAAPLARPDGLSTDEQKIGEQIVKLCQQLS